MRQVTIKSISEAIYKSCHSEWRGYIPKSIELKFERMAMAAVQEISKAPEVPETHWQGHISVENTQLILRNDINLQDADLGIQIANDGRVWLCINGTAFIRFKPKVA